MIPDNRPRLGAVLDCDVHLGRLEARYRTLVKDIVGDKRAPDLVSAVLRYGSLPRGEADLVLKTTERTARNTLSDLVDRGFLKSDTPKAPVRIAFPLDFRERLFPNLFTDAEVTSPNRSHSRKRNSSKLGRRPNAYVSAKAAN